MTEQTEVEFVNDGSVAVVGDEAYKLSEDSPVFHENDDELLIISVGEYYRAEYDENGWVVVDEDAPDFVTDALDSHPDKRYADADVQGYPIEFDVGFRSDEAVFSNAWQREVLRPASPIAKEIQGIIKEVKLTIEVEENGEVTVTDVGLWPDKSNVSLEL
jgi:hypothetical protein